MDPFTTTTLLLLFTEELLATDDEDFAELEDATELLLFAEELLATEEELFSLEELTTDEDDSTELEETTELELAIELLDCFASLAMTLEEDTSAGFSFPDEPFAEVLSSQATRPKASANAPILATSLPRANKFFFISSPKPAISKIFYKQIYKLKFGIFSKFNLQTSTPAPGGTFFVWQFRRRT